MDHLVCLYVLSRRTCHGCEEGQEHVVFGQDQGMSDVDVDK